MYLKEEVLQEGLIRKLPPFSRFLEAISFSQGSFINSTELSRELGIHRQTVENYIQILHDLLLAFQIPVFTKKAKRKMVSSSKFYYFDCGIYNALRPKGPLDQPEERYGVALETLIAQHLRAWINYRGQNEQLYFWRTQSGIEVDFIIYGETLFTAIEVKNTTVIRNQDLDGLNRFYEDYPQSQLLCIYRGTTRIQKGNVICIPADEFLVNLHPNNPFIFKQ
jgi:predicted AAA+ superfamily ATPase